MANELRSFVPGDSRAIVVRGPEEKEARVGGSGEGLVRRDVRCVRATYSLLHFAWMLGLDLFANECFGFPY